MNSQGVSRVAMAEYAEALGVPTDQVGSVNPAELVLYAKELPEPGEQPQWYWAILKRNDESGILESMGEMEVPQDDE